MTASTFGNRARRSLLIGLAAIGAITASTVAAAPGSSVLDSSVVPSPAVAVQPTWSVDAANNLLDAVEGAKAEGLRPRDYGLDRLRQAISRGPGQALDEAAMASALALAHDYALGRVGDRQAMDWHIDVSADMLNALSQGLTDAIASGRPGSYIKGLLPSDRRYQALREALATEQDGATRDMIRANLERWRWMPRALGDHYLYVNVPSYRLDVVDAGTSVSSYTVVVGAPQTPTPALASPASSLVVNPWWNVPQSIVKSSNLRPGRGGFVFKANANGGYAVRQPPGPRNALGRLKINLVNDQAIYLHDTPAKSGFVREERALSHGCIRVKDIDRLAAELMSDGAADGRLDEALADSKTETLRLPQTWQVYLVYFTADLDADGRLVTYGDPYGRDAQVLAGLDGRPMQVASR